MWGRITVTKRHGGGGGGGQKRPKWCYVINEWPLSCNQEVSVSHLMVSHFHEQSTLQFFRSH